MDSRTNRVARGLAAAGLATFFAAFSHAAAGGGAPGDVGLAVSLAFAAVVCVLLTRSRMSLPLLSVSVLVSQLGFHLLFGVRGGAALAETAPGGNAAQGAHAAHAGHDAAQMAAMMTDASSGVAASGALHMHSGWMWASHAVAAVVTIVVLRRGELALRRLVALARLVASTARARAGAVRRARTWAQLEGLLLAALRAVGEPAARSAAAIRRLVLLSQLVSTRLRDLGVLLSVLRHRGPPFVVGTHLSV